MDLAILESPSVNITVEPNDTICSWQTVYLSSNASGATSYLWTPGNFTTPEISANLSTVGALGSYWFRLIATNDLNCSVEDSVMIHFKDCLGIEYEGPAFSSEIYPVPNNGIFTLTIRSRSEERINLRLLNSLSVAVYEEKEWAVSGKISRKFDFTNLPSGVYFMELDRSVGKFFYKILIKY